MGTQFDDLKDTLRQALENEFNLLLVGPHGAAKTSVVKAAAEGRKLLYWSGPLVDPDVDIGGLPMPDEKTGTVRFFTPPELAEAEIIFIDELNRASPRALNMFFELLQFRSIHGKPLPKLKAVWAAINPPTGSYDVEKLDVALMDRFHAYFQVNPEYNADYLAQWVALPLAEALVAWVVEDVHDSHYVSPRRLEYVARLHAAGMAWEDAFDTPALPVAELRERLSTAEGEEAA